MKYTDLLFAKRDSSLPSIHPIATRRFIVYLPANQSSWSKVHTCIGHTESGDRDVFVKGGSYWFKSTYYVSSGGFDIIEYTDDTLDEYEKQGCTIFAIMLLWKNHNCGKEIACHFHAEVYDVSKTDEKTIQELTFQMKSRSVCPTDGTMNFVLGEHRHVMDELKEEKKQIETIKSDLLKESQNYLNRLKRRVGSVMMDSAPLTEETFINAGRELKLKQQEISRSLRSVYWDDLTVNTVGCSMQKNPRMDKVGLVLADSMIDRLIDNVYQQGIQKSTENLVKAIATVEAMMPPELKFTVPNDFIRLKKEQLLLAYKIEAFKREQKEKRRVELEAKREEARAQKELERERKKAEKDALAAQTAIERRKFELAQAKTKEDIEKFQMQIQKLEEALRQAQERRDRALSMAQQTKCGYVYVISNIGSFGEGVYKIGMTRRVEPMERVAELSNASVPFPFDVHAMIFTEDAPSLEAALHRTFDNRKVNAVNGRKEYFRVSLKEIQSEVRKLGIDCEWVTQPAAAQFRDSEMLHNQQ